MKKKEREHLKEDPFQKFITQSMDFLNKYKKHLFAGLAILVALAVILLLVVLFKSHAISSENRLFSQAVTIKSDENLSVDQKIEKLNHLKTKSGISSAVKLFLAALYFEKNDLPKAKEELDHFPTSSINLLNDQKKFLEAEILISSGKITEALELLNQLLANPNTEIAKDLILLKMAKIQVRNEQTETAVANLNKIVEEYPQSPFKYEARDLLARLEKD
jgi:predicted negative regulator of RcsB-dependent stress response